MGIAGEVVHLGAEDLTKLVSKEGAKVSEEAIAAGIKTGAKEGVETGAKEGAEAAAKASVKKSLLEKIGSGIIHNPKTAIAAGVAAGVATYAATKMAKVDGKVCQIMSIKNQDSSHIYLQFSPANSDFVAGSAITITASNATPAALGHWTISKIISSSEMVVTCGIAITTSGTSGSFTYNADYGAQLGDVIGDGVGGAAKVIDNAVGPIFAGMGIDWDAIKEYVYIGGGILFLLIIIYIIRSVWSVMSIAAPVAAAIGGEYSDYSEYYETR